MRRIPLRASTTRVSHERWLVSYADFMTLLFAFFATMYSISRVDAGKLSTVAHSLQAAFDDSERARAAQAATLRDRAVPGPVTASDEIAAEISESLAAELADEQITLSVDRRGVTVSIPEAGTFAVGRDDLSAGAQALVGRVAATLSAYPNAVRVEGHTDDIPIHNQRFTSNWDLSAARASRVVELLIARGINAERLSATGYGEFHPRVPNTSDEARARNRRIDLVILNAATTRAEEPADAGGQTP